jgi:hypothetical protein
LTAENNDVFVLVPLKNFKERFPDFVLIEDGIKGKIVNKLTGEIYKIVDVIRPSNFKVEHSPPLE